MTENQKPTDYRSDPFCTSRATLIENIADKMDCANAADFITYLQAVSAESGVALEHLTFFVTTDDAGRAIPVIEVNRPLTLDEMVESYVGQIVEGDQYNEKRFVNHPKDENGWPILTDEDLAPLRTLAREELIAQGYS